MVNVFRKMGKRWEDPGVETKEGTAAPPKPRARSSSRGPTSRSSSRTRSRRTPVDETTASVSSPSNKSIRSYGTPSVVARDDDVADDASKMKHMTGNETREEDADQVSTAPTEAPANRRKSIFPLMRSVEQPAVDTKPASPSTEEIGHAEVIYEEFGEEALDTITIKEYEKIPQPKRPNDVVIKVKSSTISIVDCTIRRGMYHEDIPLPNIPGFDIIGTIHKMGKSAKKSERFQEGDRVAALTRTGGNARYANVPISRLVRVPGSVDSAEAACIVTTFATAYQVLHRARPDSETHSLEGKHVLITGGSGPTGQAMIQLAHLAGASKVYSTALEKYHGMLRHLGAVPLPLTTKDWLPEVEGEMDFVADSLCQDDFASPHAALKKGGHLVVMGVSAINNTESRGMFGQPVSAKLAMFKARNVMSNTTVFDLWESFERKPEVYKRDLEYLLTLLEKEKIKPNLAGRVPLYDVPEAQKKIQEGKIRGMLVCKPWK